MTTACSGEISVALPALCYTCAQQHHRHDRIITGTRVRSISEVVQMDCAPFTIPFATASAGLAPENARGQECQSNKNHQMILSDEMHGDDAEGIQSGPQYEMHSYILWLCE